MSVQRNSLADPAEGSSNIGRRSITPQPDAVPDQQEERREFVRQIVATSSSTHKEQAGRLEQLIADERGHALTFDYAVAICCLRFYGFEELISMGLAVFCARAEAFIDRVANDVVFHAEEGPQSLAPQSLAVVEHLQSAIQAGVTHSLLSAATQIVMQDLLLSPMGQSARLVGGGHGTVPMWYAPIGAPSFGPGQELQGRLNGDDAEARRSSPSYSDDGSDGDETGFPVPEDESVGDEARPGTGPACALAGCRLSTHHLPDGSGCYYRCCCVDHEHMHSQDGERVSIREAPVGVRAQSAAPSFWSAVTSARETLQDSVRRGIRMGQSADLALTIADLVLNGMLDAIPVERTWQDVLTVPLTLVQRDVFGARPTVLRAASALASTCKFLRVCERYSEYMISEAPHRIAAAERELAYELVRQANELHAAEEERRMACVAHAYQLNVGRFREWLSQKVYTARTEIDWLLDGPVGRAISLLIPECPIGEGGIAHANGVGTWVGMQLYRYHSLPATTSDHSLHVVLPTDMELARAERALLGPMELLPFPWSGTTESGCSWVMTSPRGAVECLIAAMYHIKVGRMTFSLVREQFSYADQRPQMRYGTRVRRRSRPDYY